MNINISISRDRQFFVDFYSSNFSVECSFSSEALYIGFKIRHF